MALFLSLNDDSSAAMTGKVSLAPEDHVKVYRMWTAALVRDWLTIAEDAHINSCDLCKSAFNAAQGTDGARDDRSTPITSQIPAKNGDNSRAA